MKFLGNRRINMNKFIGCLVLSALTTLPVFAQNSTNSPYSQYGLGDLADEGVGFNKGMGGVGYAFHKGNEVNPLNPAAYFQGGWTETQCEERWFRLCHGSLPVDP